jgi:hypothetical protein
MTAKSTLADKGVAIFETELELLVDQYRGCFRLLATTAHCRGLRPLFCFRVPACLRCERVSVCEPRLCRDPRSASRDAKELGPARNRPS